MAVEIQINGKLCLCFEPKDNIQFILWGWRKNIIVKKIHENKSAMQWIRSVQKVNIPFYFERIVRGNKFEYLICPEFAEQGIPTSLRLIPLNQDCREYPAVRMFLGPAAIKHIKKWWFLQLKERVK